MNTAQAFNSLGTTLAPLIGGWLIFKNSAPDAAVRLPYVSLAVILSLIAVLMWFTKLPEPRHQEKVSKSNALGYPQLRFGMVAIFCYVGAEVAIGSLIINFLGMSDILHLPEGSAKHYLSLYWGGAMTGRFLGALALSKTMSTTQRYGGMLLIGAMMFGLLYSLNSSEHFMFDHIWPLAVLITANIATFVLAGPNPSRALGLFASVASGLLLGAIFLHGAWAMWAVIAIGLFNSIMWSNIFTLAITGLGKDTAQGSSLLVMMIVGGALIPPLQGSLIDIMKGSGLQELGFHLSFFLPFGCYAYLVWYGFRGAVRTTA